MKPFQSLAVGGLIFAGLFSLPSLARDRPPESVRSATLRQVFRTVTGKNLPSAVRIRLRGRENSGVLGTVVDADGGILTKASELEKDKRIVCRLSDGRDLPAEVVATDEATDLALLKVEAKDLTPLEWRADGDGGCDSPHRETDDEESPGARAIFLRVHLTRTNQIRSGAHLYRPTPGAAQRQDEPEQANVAAVA